ncbi:fimbrillin family protein [uncultured Bacteroides sp.]|uniref:fimbrillin family protein n=1 Tax=uncultured Bacteroides sp. TaxID=162156 RepID=UPI002AAB7A66|nr:fimbrillin family protein [uncultured Bacteroides sp.]
MKKVTLFSLSLLLLAACSSDNEPQSGTNTTDPVEIKLNAGIQSIETSTRGGGVISGTSLASALNVSLARLDATDGTPPYPQYSTLSSALAATVSTGGTIAFSTTQYYQANGYSTKLVSWYPAATPASGVITYTLLDGSTDIMLSSEVSGSKTSHFNALTFAHQLTQIQIKAYAEDDDALNLWGDITAAIKIKSQPSVCKITLPSTVTFPESNAEVSMSETSATLAVGSTSAVSCGYAMIPPATGLSIDVTTVKGGTQTVALPSQAYAAGTAYVISLLFKSTGISPTATITDWSSTTIETPVGVQ